MKMFKSSAIELSNKPINETIQGHKIHTLQFSLFGYEFDKNPENPKETVRIWMMKDWDREGKKPGRIESFDTKIGKKYHLLKDWYQAVKVDVINKAVRDSANDVRRTMSNITMPSVKPQKTYEYKAPKRIEQYSLDELAKMTVPELMELISDNFKK